MEQKALMNTTVIINSLTLSIGIALGSLLYDFVRHREELTQNFPQKYLIMFAISFVLAFIAKSVISALKTKGAAAD